MQSNYQSLNPRSTTTNDKTLEQGLSPEDSFYLTRTHAIWRSKIPIGFISWN